VDIREERRFVNLDEGQTVIMLANQSTGEKMFLGQMVLTHGVTGASASHQFEIEAKNIKQAFKAFEDRAKEEVEKIKQEMKDAIAEASKKIVVPNSQVVTPGG